MPASRVAMEPPASSAGVVQGRLRKAGRMQPVRLGSQNAFGPAVRSAMKSARTRSRSIGLNTRAPRQRPTALPGDQHRLNRRETPLGAP